MFVYLHVAPPMRPRGNVVINLKIYDRFILEHRCKPPFSVHKLPRTRSSLEVNFASFLWIMHQWNKQIELQLSKSLKISNQSSNALLTIFGRTVTMAAPAITKNIWSGEVKRKTRTRGPLALMVTWVALLLNWPFRG